MKVLHDFTYIIEAAYRISLGDVPYRDFVIPHAPLTFLIQGALMRLHDGSLRPQVWYCALMAGLTAVLTYRIIRAQIVDAGGHVAFTALALSCPVIFLNGYAILSQPFYDPDCVFFVLLALASALWARHEGGTLRHFVAGLLLVLPVFAKQNIGLAALVAIHAGLFISAIARNGRERAGWFATLAGSVTGLVIAALLVQMWIGIPQYIHWTVSYAGARRWPSPALLLAVYSQPRTWVTAACAVAGYLLVRKSGGSRWLLVVGLAVIALPLLDALRTMLRWAVSLRVAALWGTASVATLVLWFRDVATGDWRFERALPVIAVGVAHGAFASQGVIDSSYAVWPMLMIALAGVAGALLRAAEREHRVLVTAFTTGIGMALVFVGSFHMARAERLGFADLSGRIERPTLPVLQGLATPGTYISDFENLLQRTNALIPAGDAVVLIPGEDPFFFASKRRPRFPLILFDDTAVPYDTATLLQMLRDRDVKWIIVKDRLQLLNGPWRPLRSFVEGELAAEYGGIEELPRYRILKRR